MSKYFGTDGFRGKANITLTADHAYRTGRFLGWYYSRRKRSRAKILIGKDTRLSSYMLEYALAAGATASGADVYLMHVTTTPSVAYIAKIDGFDCGVVISASHNPFEDNGIKLINGGGEKADGEVVEELEAYLGGADSAKTPFATGEAIGKIYDDVAARNRYIGYLISLGVFSFRGIKVGLDCANGAAWHIAKTVFEALGATVFVINAEPDGTNINRGAGSTHIEGLQRLVLEKGLDIGFAFDGDADRCLGVDEKGRVLTGDHIMLLCAKYMKARGALVGNAVVSTVMSNLGFYKRLEEENIRSVQTAVGDKNVYESMRKYGYGLGGEESGHIIFSKYATTGDGLLTSLKVMEAMLAQKTAASAFYDDLRLYPQVLLNVGVSDKAALEEDAEVKNAVRRVADRLASDGRVLVRASGTEPLIRVMVEAESEEICNASAKEIAAVILARDGAKNT